MSEFIPIDDIEPESDARRPEEGVAPRALEDDPVLGDGSSAREGYDIATWRLHTLRRDSLVGMTEYEGNDRYSRKARRAQQASREARTAEGRKARKLWRVRVAALLTTLVAAVTAVAVTYALELWGGKSVPAVDGFTKSNAQEILEDKGFSVEFEYEPSDLLEGRVVEMSPAGGTRVEEASTIWLVIGESRIMPEVLGMERQDALDVLDEAGATNVKVQTVVALDEEEGIVKAVRPSEGSVFMSTDEITLTVSQLPRVPDVAGMSEADALKALEEAELPAHVTQERGTADDRLKVIRTEPAIGARVEAGEEVTLVMGDVLINPVRLEDYYDAKMPAIRDFLTKEGYELKASAKVDGNHVIARFESANDASLSFLPEPWTHDAEGIRGVADVLGADARIEGVRFEVHIEREENAEKEKDQKDKSSSQTSWTEDAQEDSATNESGYSPGLALLGLDKAPVSEETARSVAELCGFTDAKASCTEGTIGLPPGVANYGHSFYCCYGETEEHVWTVLVAADSDEATEASRIVVTCVPKTAFNLQDPTHNGDNICDFVAYVDEYA